MNRFSITAWIALALFAAAPAMAQDFNIDWNTVDNGGGRSTGGTYTLTGTIGQHDASSAMNGGIYALSGGFWYADPAAGIPCGPDLFPPNEICGAGDGVVDAGDLGQLLSAWGACVDCCADLFPESGGDGVVGPGDLGALLAAWGQCN